MNVSVLFILNYFETYCPAWTCQNREFLARVGVFKMTNNDSIENCGLHGPSRAISKTSTPKNGDNLNEGITII